MPQHVLLIEDEPNIVAAMRFLLSREGWSVSDHADGGSALARIRVEVPDLVILDLMLPGRSGLEILSDIRADPALAAVPVMMLTAKGQGRDREAALRAGATHFMTKPFSNSEMLAEVRAIMAR